MEKKEIDYALEKTTPIIHKVGSGALNYQPKWTLIINRKTDKPGLDGGATDFSLMYPLDLRYSDIKKSSTIPFS